jgi:hypothetical protein
MPTTFTPQKIFLVITAVRSCINPRAIVHTDGLREGKTPKTPSGIEPATFWLVAQRLNQLCHHVLPL